ncbi:MAG: M24 family metallopeptidase [Silvibacterium sp.]|nr:M24 family metallopeptidase [Silvibacterium sp.]MBV8436966.1 M24 family metallopeptidase [Silvibacterium sp.]
MNPVSEVPAQDIALRSAELNEKYGRLGSFLDRNNLSAVLLSRHENIAWITAGQVEARVALGVETAVTSLLITRSGLRYYLAPNNEAPRLADEEFVGLGYEAVIYPWYQNPAALLRELTGDTALGSDVPVANATHVNLAPLRAPLLAPEIDRFINLSRQTADATASVVESLTPGIAEEEMAARTASALLERGITPTVLLMGVDDRIRKYKHAVPRSGRLAPPGARHGLERYGMVNLCARKWGLVASITRFVHFGSVPDDLAASFTAVARIHSELLHATRAGATSAQLFEVARKAYASAGAAEEIVLHHQGGPCGYGERDWLIQPEGTDTVVLPQAFAYNPSLRGAKVEDTAVVTENQVEILTDTPTLPVIETVINGEVYRSAGILVR